MVTLLDSQLEALSLRLRIMEVEARLALLDAVIAVREDTLRWLVEDSLV